MLSSKTSSRRYQSVDINFTFIKYTFCKKKKITKYYHKNVKKHNQMSRVATSTVSLLVFQSTH